MVRRQGDKIIFRFIKIPRDDIIKFLEPQLDNPPVGGSASMSISDEDKDLTPVLLSETHLPPSKTPLDVIGISYEYFTYMQNPLIKKLFPDAQFFQKRPAR